MSVSGPRLSVIIVAHNSRPSLDSCLDHLDQAMQSQNGELLVVDNNSSDGTPSLIKRRYPRATIIPQARNIGFSAACNLAAEKSCGEFIFFLNPDVCIDADAIDRLLQVVSENSKAGLVSARLRYPEGRFQPSCRRFPTPANLLMARGGLPARLPGLQRISKHVGYTLPDYDQVTIVPAVAATAAIVRRRLFLKIGGFDERFFLFMEDTDLCLRLEKTGLVNLFVPNAGAVHLWGRGSNAGKLTRAWHHHVAVWRYFLKHYRGSFSFVILPVLLLFNLLIISLMPDRRPKV